MAEQPDYRLDVGADRARNIAHLAASVAKTAEEIETLSRTVNTDIRKLAELRSWYTTAVDDLTNSAIQLQAEQPEGGSA